MSLGSFFNLIDEHKEELVNTVREFLMQPSISGTGEGIEETASFLRDWISDNLGATMELRRYGGHPIVYGILDIGSKHTVIYYNMYDVQPVEPLEKWIVPPFKAEIMNDKIIARGAYNTKGALMSGLLGLKKYIDNFGSLPMNVIFILEGEEELGSPSMPKLIEDLKDELSKASVALFTFPTESVKGKPRVILGNKGIIFYEIRVKTSKYDIHSSLGRGLYNPAVILSKIVCSLLDPKNGPIISWLEDDVITPTDKDMKYINDIIETSPIDIIKELYQIKNTRLKGKDFYINVFFKPNVNVDGIGSGYVGPGTKTIVPADGVLKIDFRLVPNMDIKKLHDKFIKHLDRIGILNYVDVKLHDMYPWSKTDPDGKAANAARTAYKLINMRSYTIPMIPGSAPTYLFTNKLGVECVSAGPGHGGRAHAPNEYITVDTIPGIAKYTLAFMKSYVGL